jgi:hypothetical protein
MNTRALYAILVLCYAVFAQGAFSPISLTVPVSVAMSYSSRVPLDISVETCNSCIPGPGLPNLDSRLPGATHTSSLRHSTPHPLVLQVPASLTVAIAMYAPMIAISP